MRTVLAVGGGVLVLVLAVTVTYAVARRGGKDDDASKGGSSSSPTTSTAQAPGVRQPTATGSSDGGTPTSGTPSGTASGDYQVIFQDHPLTVRPPNSLDSGPDVDLDLPKVDPQHTLEGGQLEFSYSDDYLSFDTPAGKSPTDAPADCKAAAESAPLPTQVGAKDLVGTDAVLKVGDRLCTVTSSGNLAMWTITQTEPTANYYKTPVFTGALTLWKIPGGAS